MRYLSVCSGIEAATAAWHLLGWTPVAFAEIEKFPSAVLAHHYPDVPNLGDFTKIEASDVGPIDLLVGGTPCQSFSVAGKRLGLDDARGNLALEFCRLARRLRPRWVVFENVPGIHSSWSGAPDGGELSPGGRECGTEDSDFGAFLDALEECGYSACWRVLDAQFVRVDSHPRAVPQRRERVFVVGYLGDWRPPAAVLLEPEGMRRDTPPRREARQAVAGSLGAGSKRSGGRVGRREAAAHHLVAGTLGARSADHPSGIKSEADFIVPICESGKRANLKNNPKNGMGIGTPGDPMFTLGADSRHAVAFGGNNSAGPIEVATARNGHAVPHGRLDFESETFVAHALRADGFDASEEDGTGRGTPIIPLQAHGAHGSNGAGIGEVGDPALTLQADIQQAIAFRTNAAGQVDCQGEASAALTTQTDQTTQFVALPSWAVRRLTPTECELLQGFVPGFTAIPYCGKPAADGPRYKALGNSMAINCMRWIGQRIDLFEQIRMAS